MKRLLILLLLSGCNNPSLITLPNDQSVRWSHPLTTPDPPVCENEDERHLDPGVRLTCIWECKNFWTPLRGAGRYSVARTWRWNAQNNRYEMTTLGTDPQWHEPCDDLPVTNCPDC